MENLCTTDACFMKVDAKQRNPIRWRFKQQERERSNISITFMEKNIIIKEGDKLVTDHAAANERMMMFRELSLFFYHLVLNS